MGPLIGQGEDPQELVDDGVAGTLLGPPTRLTAPSPCCQALPEWCQGDVHPMAGPGPDPHPSAGAKWVATLEAAGLWTTRFVGNRAPI